MGDLLLFIVLGVIIFFTPGIISRTIQNRKIKTLEVGGICKHLRNETYCLIKTINHETGLISVVECDSTGKPVEKAKTRTLSIRDVFILNYKRV
jgi:hypothetical protein